MDSSTSVLSHVHSNVFRKKDDVKLEWMYKGPSHNVNHEDYLLGKAIDKNFEKHQQEQQRGGPSTSQDEGIELFPVCCIISLCISILTSCALNYTFSSKIHLLQNVFLMLFDRLKAVYLVSR